MRRVRPTGRRLLDAARRHAGTAMLFGCTTLLATEAPAQTVLPQGGNVVSGQASISSSAAAVTVNQSSARAIVNWNSFSVGSGGTVNFVQPGTSSAILNRVTGTAPSSIAGSVTGNGQVFLVNPNGIAITPTGSVQVGGGFVASTLDIRDSDFNSGNYTMTGRGASAAVRNAGRISGARGAFVGLVGGSVSNSGTISVPLGKVGLGAGEKVTLDPSGEGFLQVTAPTSATTADGRALIDVSGEIRAPGGSVEIRAAAAQEAVRDVVNVSGVVSTRSVTGRTGSIFIDSGGGTVTVTGRVAANGGKRHKGGTIVVTGKEVTIGATARISADGTSGGTILIGGDLRGGVDALGKLISTPVATALRTTIAEGARISANGTAGAGGNVVVWSDKFTDFRGAISATGTGTGDGGNAEVSGKERLDFRGSVDLTAQNGKTGSLLLDPYDIVISSGTDTTVTNAGNVFSPTANSSILSVGTLQTALASANVTVNTGAGGSQAGNITVQNLITWASANTLTLNAAGAITINAPIVATAGGLVLTAGGSASPISVTDAIIVASLNVNRGAWSQVAASLPTLRAGDFTIGANASFLRAAGGNGTGGTPYLLTDIYGVQGIGSSATLLAAQYRLSNDIDASVTSGWNGGAGLKPVGTLGSTGFSGVFDGANYALTKLYINRSGTDGVGLFGYVNGGTIQNLYLLNADVTGSSTSGLRHGSGTLVGVAENATIQNVTVTGLMTGVASDLLHDCCIGGIVGQLYNNSVLQNSAAAVDVTSTIGRVGGAVGSLEFGSNISNVSARGNVSAPTENYVGGLVGAVSGDINNSYVWGGTVTGNSNVGGLIGYASSGSVSNNYVANTVNGNDPFNSYGVTGGVGIAIFSNNHWNTDTAGVGFSGSFFGTQGLTTAQMLVQGNFGGFDFTNTWFQTAGYYPTLRNATTIIGPAPGSSGGDMTVSSGADTTRTNVGGTTNVNVTSLQNLLGVGDVLVSTVFGSVNVNNNLTWSSNRLGLAGNGSVTAGVSLTSAAGSLGITGGSVSLSGGTINLGGTLNVLGIGSGIKGVGLNNTTITTGSGASRIAGNSSGGSGVQLDGSNSLTVSGGGTLVIAGLGLTGSGDGLNIGNGSTLTTSGTVDLSGTSISATYGAWFSPGTSVTNTTGNLTIRGLNAASNVGTLFNGTTTLTNSGAGTIDISGRSFTNSGITLNAAALTTSGTVNLAGQSSTGTALILDGTTLTNSSGNFTATGTSADGIGVFFTNAAVTLTNNGGTFSISGSSASKTEAGMAINVDLTTTGNISLAGSNSNTANGVWFLGTKITDTAGNLTITGTSVGESAVWVQGSTLDLVNSGAGTLQINGNHTGTFRGIRFNTGANLKTTGQVVLAGSSTAGEGLSFKGTNTVTIVSGTPTFTGTSTTGNGAVYFQGNATIDNQSGATVTFDATSTSGQAFKIENGVALTTSGPLLLRGTSTSGTGLFLAGNDSITVNSGLLTLRGSTTSGPAGIDTSSSGNTITNNGVGLLTLWGTGGTRLGATISSSGANVIINDNVNVNQSAGTITTGGLKLMGGGNFSLGGANLVGTLGAGTVGSLLFNNAQDLTIGTVQGTAGVTATSTVTLQSTGTITSNASIATTGGAGVTLQANDSIVVNSGGISTQGQAITLNGDRDASGAGSIALLGGTIASNGGNITLGGGGSPSTTAAFGTVSFNQGVLINGNTTSINAGGGNVSIRGQSLAAGASAGVEISGGATVTTTGGNITIVGVGTGTTGASPGVYINGTGTLVQTQTGTIDITGTGSTTDFSHGIGIDNSAVVAATGIGNINLTGLTTGTNDSDGVSLTSGGTVRFAGGAVTINGTGNGNALSSGFELFNSSALEGTAGGSITITASGGGSLIGDFSITTGTNYLGQGLAPGTYTGSITVNANTLRILQGTIQSTGGALVIQPRTASTSIGIGDSAVGTLNLPASALSLIQPGFSSITIGSASGTGAVDVRNYTANAPLTIRSPAGGGTIMLNGALATGAGGSAGSITLIAGGALTGAASSSITTQNRAISLTGSPVSGAMDIASNGGLVTVNQTGSGTISGVISGAGGLTKTGSGTLILSGASTYTGTTTVSAGTLDLSGSWNIGAGAATISVANGATLTGSGVITAATLTDSGGGTVNLTGNNAVGTLTGSGTVGALTFNNAQDLSVGSISSTGAVTITTSAGGNLSVANAATLTSSAGGTAMTLVSAGNLTIGVGASISAASPVLAAANAFINNSGAGALTASSGRWLIYSASPGGNIFGGLDSGNTPIWNATYGAPAPGAVSQTGNRYLFATQPTLTFTSIDATKSYGTDATATVASSYSVSGYQSGVAGAYLGDNAASTFSGAPAVTSAGSPAAASIAGSPYPITVAQGTLTALNGYAFNYVSSGSLTISTVVLTITALNQSKTYGSVAGLGTSAFTTSGLQPGDSVSAVTLTSTGSGAGATVAGGPYAIVPSNAVGTGLSNYTISYVNGQLTVNPAPVNVTALGGSSTYGSSPSNPGLSATGLQNGETVGVLTGLTNSFGITGTSSAGSYVLSVAGSLTNTNYTVASTSNGSWIVNPAPITVTALGGSSTYGASPANPGLSATGLQNGETTSVLTGLSNSFGITNTTPAGSYTMTVAGALTNGNYTVTNTFNGTWDVLQRALTITASNQAKTYGSIAALGTSAFTTSGLTNGDSVSSVNLFSTGAAAAATVAGGPYAIVPSGATGSGLSNYAISYVNGQLTVNPAPISVSALGGASTYGASPANPGLAATGLQNGETASVLTGLSNSFGIVGTTNAGSYVLSVVGTLTNANYTVTGTSPANWTVNPAPVTVTALGGSSFFGDSPANPGLSASGLQNGQGVGVLTGLANAFGITSTTGMGTYLLDATGSLSNPNYTLAGRNQGSWTVSLRGTVNDGSSPSNPGLFNGPPGSGQGDGPLGGFEGASGKVNAASAALNPAGAAASQGSRAGSPFSSPGAAAPSSSLPTNMSVPLGGMQEQQAAAPPALIAPSTVPATPVPPRGGSGTGNCDGAAGDGGGGVGTGSGTGGGCATQPARKKPSGLLDFAFAPLSPDALASAISQEFTEMVQSTTTPQKIAVVSIASTSVMVTAGLIGWLLRGGALLGAFVSTMPMWRGFDPLLVVTAPRRREERNRSAIDELFDSIGGGRRRAAAGRA